MKKQLFLLGLAVAAMTSCTNDEVVEMMQPTQKAIGFETFVNKGTRADIDNNNPLNEFYVYGFYGEGTEVFDNVTVYAENSDWKINQVKNWDTQYYYFAAYANGEGTGAVENPDEDKLEDVTYSYNSTNSSAVLTFTDYAIAEEFENQKDLVASQTHRDNRSTFNQEEVDLTFSHMLSKVSFTFKNNSEENLDMVISDVTLNVNNKATCNYTYDSNTSSIVWSEFTNTDGFTAYDITFDDYDESSKIGRGSTTTIVGTSYVIPQQTNPTITFKVEYFDKNGTSVEGPTNKTLSLYPETNFTNGATWVNSNVYNYIINLPASPKQINFNVSKINGWTENNDIPIDGSGN